MTEGIMDFKEAKEKILVALKSSSKSSDFGSASLEKYHSELPGGHPDKRNMFDLSMREYLATVLQKIKEPREIEPLLNLSIELGQKDICSAMMPIVLLSDAFDALTLDQCENLFHFVENGVSTWKQEAFFTACKNTLLRMCNDLLRRLSRSQNTVFCGRILLFLAKFFPFSERSGLNILSEFNLDNITTFGTDEDDASVLNMDTEEEDLELGEIAGGPRIDYNLYCKFWSLQDFFRNPSQCYSKIKWKTFVSYSTDVLSTFSSFKLESLGSKKGSGQAQSKDYFAKFLTNQKLLKLQLGDSTFRRFVLVQFLVLFRYLMSAVKLKNKEAQVLTDDQSEWVKDEEVQIIKLLEETPPDGATFTKTILRILKREEQWSIWKNNGCPEFNHPPVEVKDDIPPPTTTPTKLKSRKRCIGDELRDAVASKRFATARNDMVRLWHLNPNNLQACKSKDRDFLPQLDSYFDTTPTPPSASSSNDTDTTQQTASRYADSNFGWRALRLLSRRSMHFFIQGTAGIIPLPAYLDHMAKKIQQDQISATAQVATEPEISSDTGVNGAEEEENLLQEENRADDQEESGTHVVVAPTLEQLAQLAERLGEDWKKLARKLTFRDDEITLFETDRHDDKERGAWMLQVWLENEDEPDARDLVYALGGVGMADRAKGIFAMLDD